jgi:hypothetical protein
MRRSSSIRFLSAVIGETSVTDDNTNRPQSPPPATRRANRRLTKSEPEDETLLKLPLAAQFDRPRVSPAIYS